jgi:AcrR family transcriptional regulator
VTVTPIADPAGITRRSYFRYFPDKREVLFVSSERLPAAAAEADSPLSTVLGARSEVGTQLVQYVDHTTALFLR